MQTISPQKQSFVGLSGAIKSEMTHRNQAIAALAASCLQDQKDGKSFDVNKTRWNTEYHKIVTESVQKITDATHTLSDAAKTPEAQQALFSELKKAYE